jgi:hypothetical protein
VLTDLCFANTLSGLKPIHYWQLTVHEDEIIRPFLSGGACLWSISSDDNTTAKLFQHLAGYNLVQSVVVHEQNVRITYRITRAKNGLRGFAFDPINGCLRSTKQWPTANGLRKVGYTRDLAKINMGPELGIPRIRIGLEPTFGSVRSGWNQGYEALDQNQPMWSPEFRRGNCLFLTTRLWGVANQPPFFHHGLFTTLRESVLAHHGEAESSRAAFLRSSDYDRDSLIEFLKTLQVLPPGTRDLIVDENFRKKTWPVRSSLKP